MHARARTQRWSNCWAQHSRAILEKKETRSRLKSKGAKLKVHQEVSDLQRLSNWSTFIPFAPSRNIWNKRKQSWVPMKKRKKKKLRLLLLFFIHQATAQGHNLQSQLNCLPHNISPTQSTACCFPLWTVTCKHKLPWWPLSHDRGRKWHQSSFMGEGIQEATWGHKTNQS